MDFFKRYSSIGGGQQQSASETIQRLADRVETSTLLEDRRAAVLGLKGLSREYKEEVGDASLLALLKVLKEDSEDQNSVKAVLETLTNLCTRDPPRGDAAESAASVSDPVSDKFAQTIIDDGDNISTLLELLGDADFYVRFYTVQLLGALHMYSGEQLQSTVLVSPTGVGRLVDLLSDQRDIIRNEGIQLLIAMTESNADIQKIVAFENAFDRLLGIVNEEGGVRGNIVVQDCLQLLHNLLNYNVSNQNFFRETSGIQRLPDLLITDPSQTAAGQNGHALPDTDEDFEWTAQHARNMLVVLDIIRMLIQPGNTNTESNQTAMQQYGIIPPLLQLSLAYEAPSSVRSQALYAIGDIIRSHQANQGLFQRILITAAPMDDDSEAAAEKAIPEPAIVIVIRLSVGQRPTNVPAHEYYIVRSAAAYLVQAYVGGNPDAQLALAATLTPPGDSSTVGEPEKHQSAGSLVVSVLLDWREASRQDVWRVWYASLLLSTILRGYNQCKEQALKISLGDESKGEDPLPLINELMSQARHATQECADARVSISLLALICVWVVDFPSAASTLLDESSNTSFLVEQINGSSGVNTLVQGVAAFLFGLIYQFNTDPGTPVTRESLYPILSKRVGTDQLLIRVQRLRDSKEFQYAVGLSAGTHSNAYGGVPTEIFFDNVFTDLFKVHYEVFRAAVRMGPNEPQANPNFAYLQGGMAGYAGSATPTSAPGTPMIGGGAGGPRSLSPNAATDSANEPLPVDGRPSEPTVPKSELDSFSAKLAEYEDQISRLQSALEESRKAADADLEKRNEDIEAEKKAEEERQASDAAEKAAQAEEIAALRQELSEAQSKLADSQQQGQPDADNNRVAELEKQLAGLTVAGESKESEWQVQREELQKKLSNAEKQVVKAAAAVRNTNKKKEKQQTAAFEALEKDVKAKDEKIAELEAQLKDLSEKTKQLESVEELKVKLASLEKEQEDLLVYLADQDQQAKEFRAKLRKYGEDIPPSDDEDEEDDDEDDDDGDDE